MRIISIIPLFAFIAVSAQIDADSLFKFRYELSVPEKGAYYYMEYETIYGENLDSSFYQYMDTNEYNVAIVPLDRALQPTFLTSRISLLDSNKDLISEFKKKNFDDDTIQVQMSPDITYIAFDYNRRRDTVHFKFNYDQIPKRIMLVCGDDGFYTPVLYCKRKITFEEMSNVYYAVKLQIESNLEKCGVCYRLMKM